MAVYHNSIPLDARIFIDYKSKKVSFEFPSKGK
jgi:hypothetical protein